MKKNINNNPDNCFISYYFEDDIINCMQRECKYSISLSHTNGAVLLTIYAEFQMGDTERCNTYQSEEYVMHDLNLAERIYKMSFTKIN